MSDGYIQFKEYGQPGKRQDHSVSGSGDTAIYRQRVECYSGNPVTLSADGRARTSNLTPLFDGKVLHAEDAELWTSGGTGTATWTDHAVVLAVAAGEYMVRQTRQYFPYASGYPAVSEITFQDFQLEPGLIKRYGRFSSSAVAPYTANLDGWYVESNGDDGTFYLVVVNNGTEKLRLPWTQWSNYADISGYDFEQFTVTLTDFLWLGGAVLRSFLKLPSGGFAEVHQFDYAGSAKGVFMSSPNQPIRYEIRSTTGAGIFTTICSQAAVEGATSVTGKPKSLFTTSVISANVVGTVYAVHGVRKLAAYRDLPIRIASFGMGVTTSDTGIVLLLRNPTLSAPLTWATNGYIEEGTATTQTVTANGWVVGAFPINAAGANKPLDNSTLSWLSTALDDTPDTYVLAYLPLTTNQSVGGTIDLVQY